MIRGHGLTTSLVLAALLLPALISSLDGDDGSKNLPTFTEA